MGKRRGLQVPKFTVTVTFQGGNNDARELNRGVLRCSHLLGPGLPLSGSELGCTSLLWSDGWVVLLSPTLVAPHHGQPWLVSAEEETENQGWRFRANSRHEWIWPLPAWKLGWEGGWRLPPPGPPQSSRVLQVMGGGGSCPGDGRSINGGLGGSDFFPIALLQPLGQAGWKSHPLS